MGKVCFTKWHIFSPLIMVLPICALHLYTEESYHQVNKLSFEVKRDNLSGGPPTVTHLGINPLQERMSPDSLMAINYASNLHKQANFSPNPPGLMRTKHILCI